METATLRCAPCGRGQHHWSPQTHEDIGAEGHSVRLYRWDCVCQGCATPCKTQRVQMHPDPPPEDEMSVTALRPSGAVPPPGPARTRGEHLPWPVVPSARAGDDQVIVALRSQPEWHYVDSAFMLRVLHGLRNL